MLLRKSSRITAELPDRIGILAFSALGLYSLHFKNKSAEESSSIKRMESEQ